VTRKKRDLTVIATHVNADFDALASMLAASLFYPGAVVAFPGSQERSLKNFFLQSALYLLPLERPKDIDINRVGRLVLVDTRQKSRIGRFAKLVDGRRSVEIHIYDHHPPSEDDITGDVEFIEEIGACTSLMTRLLIERGIDLDEDQATLLSLGIYEDTGSFTFSSTTPADLAAAAQLLERGANINTVASLITRELDAGQVGLLHDLIQYQERLRISGVEVVIATCSSDSYSPDFAVVAHRFMDMENLNVLFALAQMENRIHLVARSRLDEVDVGVIAAALGGGGHPSAASATIKGQTLIEVRQRLALLLESQIYPRRTAREIMSFPVLSVSPKTNLQETHDALTRYSVNVLLVMDGPKLKGLISRQVVEKGLYLGLSDLSAGEYMNPEAVTIQPAATLSQIQEEIVGRRQRILPVVEEGKVIGVVTRSDLLNILMNEPPVPDALYDSRQARNYVRKKNLAALMSERLPEKIINLLKEMGQVGDELGYNVYAVGGFVRDLLLRRSNLDMDLVVEGDGIAFAQAAAKRCQARVRIHEKFGTAILIFPDRYKIDVATARLEYYESPAAIPIVELSSLKLDLYRRDFTINTMAVKLNQPHFGILIDYFSAQRDIKERSIRVLHSLSLVEDPTRALRTIRFEQRFKFKIGKLTSNLITNAVRINAFSRVNPARLLHELIQLLEESNPAPALRRMNEYRLWPAIYPQLKVTAEVENRIHQVHTVLAWFDLLYLESRFTRWIIYFLALTDHLNGRQAGELIERLALMDRDRQTVLEGRAHSRRILTALRRRPEMKPSTLYHLLEEVPLEGLLWAMAKGEEEKIRRAFSFYFTELVKVGPLLDGEALKEMGFTPGPIFRKILDALRDARLNGQVRTLEEEKAFVVKKFTQAKER